MKRTGMIMVVGETATKLIYRKVMTDGQRFYVKWNHYGATESELIDVTDKERFFLYDGQRAGKSRSVR